MNPPSVIQIKSNTLDECAPTRRGIYNLNFLLAISLALTSYFNAPLLISRGIPEASLGVVYAVAAAISILFLFFAPRIFNILGGFESFTILVGLNALSLVGLAIAQGPIATLLFFAALIITSVIVFLLLDMFLEGSTPKETETGSTRAFFLTMSNLAWVGAPLLAGVLSFNGNFSYLYLFAAALFVPILIITAKSLHSIVDHHYDVPKFSGLLNIIPKNKDMRNVFFAQFLLRIFFSIMVVYGPIYLLNYVGLSFVQMGAVLSIAMIAYIMLEIPVGKIADKYIGEKEMMIAGFIIIALSTITFAYIATSPIWMLALVLFTTRVGAAVVEITTESYFFKKVDGDDADDVGMFRALSPLSYIVGPLLGGLALIFVSIPQIFALLGLVMFVGVPVALALRDTR